MPAARCILIVAANPAATERLRLDREVKLIRERLDEAEHGRSFRVEVEWAVSALELSKYLLKYRPAIVHFCGHGSPTGQLILEAASGKAEVVPAAVLTSLFGTLKGTEAVVLNACYSQPQAEALAQVVPHVIGMAHAIYDESSLRFAGGFYRGLAFGKDYATAFRLGCLEIDLAGLPDALVPHFTTHAEDMIGVADAVTGSIALQRPQRTWPSGTADDAPPPRLCTLWYGTNRRPVDPANPARGYTGERDERATHCGQCLVSVPKSHRIGAPGSSWWRRLRMCESDRLSLVEASALAAGALWQAARAELAQWDPGERRALVIVHGFNVGFEQAALHAAQVATDLQLPGITAFYSWPSQAGGVISYAADAASVDASAEQFTGFLTQLVAEGNAERVDLLAHGMGNRVLLRALQRISQPAAGPGTPRFGQLLLVAPDLDGNQLRDLATICRQLAQGTTLYISSKDRAPGGPGSVHDHAAAGYAPPLMIAPGIDTVEVWRADLTFLGHGYYAAARELLRDMHALIMHGTRAEARAGLVAARTSDGQPYWQTGA
ncbi:MAG TPA: alpha/beta hydrolase [Kofleriaceae bacterium]|nr:alpha/beta hydrolase [Kofleriaceae bacterium]